MPLTATKKLSERIQLHMFNYFQFFHYFRADKPAMMNKWIIFPVLLFLICCKGEEIDTYLTPEKASRYFKRIEEVCNKDNGKLWGENLYGPLMLVDRASRNIYANQPDKEGLLKEKDGIYTGSYPKELLVNNTPIEYGGILFAITSLPRDEDEYRIKTRAIHSLFHLSHMTEDMIPSGYNTSNMDEKEVRLWIKLEWKALKNALKAEGKERQMAIRDALIFKGANRELYQMYTDDEDRFETNEGLATFTYTLLCTNSAEENKSRLLENLNRIYFMRSFVRSYGFIDGALYANLLYDKGFNFRDIQIDSFNLGNAVSELYNIELPAICRDVAGSLAVNYDVESIIKEEDKRLSDITARIHRKISTFTEKPVVFLELESPYFDFEPEDINPLDTMGTLYNSIRVSDNWGKLTVDRNGCLVSNNFNYLPISAKGYKENRNHISGEGWDLILNSEWKLVEVNQNYYLRKLMP